MRECIVKCTVCTQCTRDHSFHLQIEHAMVHYNLIAMEEFGDTFVQVSVISSRVMDLLRGLSLGAAGDQLFFYLFLFAHVSHIVRLYSKVLDDHILFTLSITLS